MGWPLFLIAALTLLLAGAVTWGLARRYGRRQAMVVPVLALVATAVILWRAQGIGGHGAMGVTAVGLVFLGPTLAGAILGLTLSPWPRR